MNCPHCSVHVDEHEASDCFDLWVLKDVFGWTTSTKPYEGDFYPKGSYFVIWHPPDDFMPEILLIVSQAFDKNGNNLRSTDDNPLGVWDETFESGYSLQYSTDIAAAWEVIRKIRGWRMEAQYKFVDILYGVMQRAEELPKGALMLLLLYVDPHAICRAAIKATPKKQGHVVTIQVPINNGWTIEQQGSNIKAEYYDPEEEGCPKAKNG